MKSLIIYYSASGNTRKVAHAIHKGISQINGECDIVAIKGSEGVPGMRMGHLLEYDLIGIGAPVWRGIFPPNVMAFIDNFPSYYKSHLHRIGHKIHVHPKKRKHAFVFSTHATRVADAMKTAWTALKQKDLTIIGFNDWYGGTYITYAEKPHPTDGHPDDIDLRAAEDFGKEMAKRSHKIYQGETDLIPKLPTGEEYRNLFGWWLKQKQYPKWFHHNYSVTIDRDKCTSCNLCVDHCPMGAIDLEADPPVLGNCCYCTVCEMVCPTGAVDCDMERVKKDQLDRNSVGGDKINIWHRIRHTHFDPIHDQLVPEKRLRWLVKPEDVGQEGIFCDLTTHPRIKIPSEGWSSRSQGVTKQNK